MDRVGINDDELWDEDDGFFYDVLCLPNGRCTRLKVRSMVGLIPLFATAIFDGAMMDKLPVFKERVDYFVRENSTLMDTDRQPLG